MVDADLRMNAASGRVNRVWSAFAVGWAMMAGFVAGCAQVRPVVEGEVYRANWRGGGALEPTLQDRQIRTVINLSGFHPDEAWYQDLNAACKKQNVALIDVALPSQSPDREELIELLQNFRQREKPILMVSHGAEEGAGFAAALYRLAILEEPKDAARKELAFWESRRSPISSWRGRDQFIYEWLDERAFYDQYQVDREAPSIQRVSYGQESRAREDDSTVNEKPAVESRWRSWARRFWEGPKGVALYNGPGDAPEAVTAVRDYSSLLMREPAPIGPNLVGWTQAPTLVEPEPAPRTPRPAPPIDDRSAPVRLGSPTLLDDAAPRVDAPGVLTDDAR